MSVGRASIPSCHVVTTFQCVSSGGRRNFVIIEPRNMPKTTRNGNTKPTKISPRSVINPSIDPLRNVPSRSVKSTYGMGSSCSGLVRMIPVKVGMAT